MKTAAFALLMLAAAGIFVALGTWQIERLHWKRALIAQTEHNLAAEPVAPPGFVAWGGIGSTDAYMRVKAEGHYVTGKDIFVTASTRYGRGYWVMTPLEVPEGFTVLVNRGFITPAQRVSLTVPPGRVTVNGLLRLSEPGGSLLQRNRPQEGRWYSRDVQAIADAQKLGRVAPYFIDAAAGGADAPVGGLTVVQFRNSHLQYALTWFALAVLCAGGFIKLLWGIKRRNA